MVVGFLKEETVLSLLSSSFRAILINSTVRPEFLFILLSHSVRLFLSLTWDTVKSDLLCLMCSVPLFWSL